MTNRGAAITENTATVVEQGAHVAPEKTSSKKDATEKKGVPRARMAPRAKPRTPLQVFSGSAARRFTEP